VKVGEGDLTSPLPFGLLPGAKATRVGESFGVAEPPFLLAKGFDELSDLPELDSIYRTYAWSVPLAPRSIHPWEIDSFETRATRTESMLRALALLDLSALVASRGGAKPGGSPGEFLLVGGCGRGAPAAFAGSRPGMRRDVEAAAQRLTPGSRPTLAGAPGDGRDERGGVPRRGRVGWAPLSATALLADEAGSPGAVLGHSACVFRAAAAVGLALAGALVLIVVLSVPGVSLAGARYPLGRGGAGRCWLRPASRGEM
jgi:hypothetical protein